MTYSVVFPPAKSEREIVVSYGSMHFYYKIEKNLCNFSFDVPNDVKYKYDGSYKDGFTVTLRQFKKNGVKELSLVPQVASPQKEILC